MTDPLATLRADVAAADAVYEAAVAAAKLDYDRRRSAILASYLEAVGTDAPAPTPTWRPQKPPDPERDAVVAAIRDLEARATATQKRNAREAVWPDSPPARTPTGKPAAELRRYLGALEEEVGRAHP